MSEQVVLGRRGAVPPDHVASAVASVTDYPDGYIDSLVAVLDAVRRGEARTRPALVRVTGLGRNVVTQRVSQLTDSGLLVEGDLGPSTGGRAPRELRFNAGAGIVVGAELGATSIGVALSDLAGELFAAVEQPASITDGPVAILGRVHALARGLLDESSLGERIWGVGVGLPGPVEFATGRPIAPPIMPGWDGFPVRQYFAERFEAPTWVDNDVNIMALGEHQAGIARGARDFAYVKIGSGIGAGLVSNGKLHRGAQGCAGDIGHIAVAQETDVVCRCGRIGCLEAIAGGAALKREGQELAASGRSPYLAALAAKGHAIDAVDVGQGAEHGDAACMELLTRSGRVVGEALAGLVSVFNPSVMVIGGGVSTSGDSYLAAIKEAILRRALPLATRDLRVARSPLAMRAGLSGAAFMVLDELFNPPTLAQWIEGRTPAGRPELAASA